jgi:8-oxo-dGTP pyrophosphatase MutT (NUDIX family)
MPLVGVEGVVFDDAGRALLTQRRDIPFWCLPGGRAGPGETPMEAVTPCPENGVRTLDH